MFRDQQGLDNSKQGTSIARQAHVVGTCQDDVVLAIQLVKGAVQFQKPRSVLRDTPVGKDGKIVVEVVAGAGTCTLVQVVVVRRDGLLCANRREQRMREAKSFIAANLLGQSRKQLGSTANG